jgi:hypothetical protein
MVTLGALLRMPQAAGSQFRIGLSVTEFHATILVRNSTASRCSGEALAVEVQEILFQCGAHDNALDFADFGEVASTERVGACQTTGKFCLRSHTVS